MPDPALIPSSVKGANVSDLSRTLKESWTLVEARQDKTGQPVLRPDVPGQSAAPWTSSRLQMDESRSRPARLDHHGHPEHRRPRPAGRLPGGPGPRPPQIPRKHAEHYDLFGRAIRQSLRDLAEGQWCDEYDDAWREAYGILAGQDAGRRRGADRAGAGGTPRLSATSGAGRDTSRVFNLPSRWSRCRNKAGQHVSVECGYHAAAVAPRTRWPTRPAGRAMMEFHVRATGAGWVFGCPGPPAQARRHAQAGLTDGRDDRGPEVHEGTSCCVAGGTGLAPVKAIVQELTRFNRTRWVHVFVGARNEEGLYDLADLVRLAARYPWLVGVVPACSNTHRVRRRAREGLRRAGPVRSVARQTTSSSPARPYGQGDPAPAGRDADTGQPDQI